MFAKNTSILLEDGVTMKYVQDLRPGDVLFGGHKVRNIIEHCHGPFDAAIVSPGLTISLWHPIKVHNTFWAFPIHSAHSYMIDVNEPMYDIALYSGHTVRADGLECCTLGHGIDDLVASHPYFGTDSVIEDIAPHEYIKLEHLTVLRNSDGLVYKWIF